MNMFKWLDKVIPGDTKTSPTVETSPAPPPVSEDASPIYTDEPPLPAPVIDLDNTSVDEAFNRNILSRHVLIDRAYHPVGYEFRLRAYNATHEENPANLLINLIGNLNHERLTSGRQTWIRLHSADLANTQIDNLDPEIVVLVIDNIDLGTEQLETTLTRARYLLTKGYKLALANWKDTALHQSWLGVCRFVEIGISMTNPVEIGEWPEKLKALAPGINVVASGVDSWEELEFCHRAKYDYFRGEFLTQREHWPRQPKTNPERMRICDMLNRLHAGAELTVIGEQLRLSPELSYRLLRYINSAGVGLLVRIASVQRGLVILGRDKVYRWLTVLLFSSGQGKSLDNALLEQALVRARIMETLGDSRFNRVQIDELFIVGIFSLLDMLLKMPMSVALEPLKLPDVVQRALLDDGGEYAPYLTLAIASEKGDSATLKQVGEQLGISVAAINAAQLESLVWAQQTLFFE